MMSSTISTSMPTQKPALALQKKYPMRLRIARQILIFHLALIAISFVFFIFRGFDGEEFASLIGLLAPVTALYGGAVFRFLGRSITEPIASDGADIPVANTVQWLVYGHFITTLVLISTKALAPNILNFTEMTMGLTLVESGIGVYMGSLLIALFQEKV